jgi:3-hydroxyisobutyrate dehydrogenase
MSTHLYGWIGLGNMGGPMAANLAKGFDTLAFDAAGTEARLPEGAVAAASTADVASGAETVFLSLPDGPIVLAVVADLIAAANRRAATVIDLSTIGVAAAKAAAETCNAAGVTYIDCPVSGGVVGARAATIASMWAGPADLLEAHRPALAAISKNIFHVGAEAGMGQTVKLLNNFLSATTMAATSEAVHFGMSQGIDMQTILDVVNVSSGRSYGSMDKFPRHVQSETYDSFFDMPLMAKDLTLFEESQAAAGTHNRIGQLIADVWRTANGHIPGADHTEIYRAIGGETGASKKPG